MRKKSLLLLLLLFLVVGTLIPAYAAHAQEVNLISNPSLETPDATGTIPLDWQNAGWGTNTTTFSYLNTGEDGTRSVSINMTSYSSGDAKWYFNPVPVSPNTSYLFSDYYQASVPTSIIAWIVDTAGNSQYVTLGTAPASTSWSNAKFIFTAPATAQTVTILHVISAVGYLQTDNYVLRLATVPTITDNVPNNSMEQVSDLDPTQPLDWVTNSWGTNTVQFSYLNTGHTGSHSIETDITSYTSGDAKWYYTPQPVLAGMQYKFTDYYMSNIPSQIMVMITKTDGSIEYIPLRHAEPASTWTRYTDTFVTPPNSQTMTVLHLIAGVGYLTTDDYTITPYTPVGFNNAMVSLTFDDGWQSQYTNGLPILNSYNVKGTFFLVSGFLNTPNYLTTAQAKAIEQAGNEIGSHTVNHPDLTTLSAAQLTYQLAQSKQTLESLFGPIRNFASPYGAYNDQVIAAIKHYYNSHRSTDAGYNSKDNFDIYNIRTQTVLSTTTVQEIDSWIAQAQHDKTWLVLLIHEVNTSGDLYSITPQDFNTVLQYIKSIKIRTLTVQQALNEVVPQTR
jgi:peptidoglycan/xylan/chitin deacetylase (PgdA/CDA1 family)